MSGDIFLNIDVIVLRGLSQIDRYALTKALQRALLEQVSLKREPGTSDLSLVKTAITLPSGFGANHLEQAIAQSVGGVLFDDDLTVNRNRDTRQGGRNGT